MNTLDKVIKTTQNIQTTFKRDGCFNCNFYAVCKHDCYIEDLLHYLNDYKIKDKKYESALERLEESRKRYLSEYQKIEDEYEELKDWWAEEHAENVPLSWDELKQMTGKPVWVEYISCKRKAWVIIDCFYTDAFQKVKMNVTLPHDYWNLEKEMLGKTWQAYIKEPIQ